MAVSLVLKPQTNMQTMNNGEAVPDFPLEGVINELKEILQEVDLHPGTRAKVRTKRSIETVNYVVKTLVSGPCQVTYTAKAYTSLVTGPPLPLALNLLVPI